MPERKGETLERNLLTGDRLAVYEGKCLEVLLLIEPTCAGNDNVCRRDLRFSPFAQSHPAQPGYVAVVFRRGLDNQRRRRTPSMLMCWQVCFSE